MQSSESKNRRWGILYVRMYIHSDKAGREERSGANDQKLMPNKTST